MSSFRSFVGGITGLAVLLAFHLPAHADCPYGEDQCLPGFVWRGAFPGDHVCVDGQAQQLAAQENAAAASLVDPDRPGYCRQNYKWREGDSLDKACVTGAARDRVAGENRLADQRRDAACTVPRTPTSLGVLALNVAGLPTGDGFAAKVPWDLRAQRIAASLRRNRLVPDVITLTEVHGWLSTPLVRSCGLGLGVGAGDYDQLDVLISQLARELRVPYRIAYSTGDVASFGGVPCSVFFAQAMLYRSDRITHVPPPANVPTFRHDGHDALIGTPHLRRSLPACNRGTHLTSIESLIDGPAQTDKCNRATPSGPAWTVFGSDKGHVSSSLARFAFTADPARVFDIFIMQPTANLENQELPGILRLVAEHTPPPYAGTTALYPPLLSGDFNVFAGDIDARFPGFTRVASADGDVMAVALGRDDRFPFALKPRVARTAIIPDRPDGVACGDPRFQISDHCGVFVRFDQDGPNAGALRGVFIDGPSQAVSGEPLRLQATASGGGANLSYSWSPGAATGAVLNVQAGSAGTTQTWTVTVTDSATQQRRSASQAVTYTAPPSHDECLAACTSDRNECMAEVGQAGGPTPQSCVAAFNDCRRRCR